MRSRCPHARRAQPPPGARRIGASAVAAAMSLAQRLAAYQLPSPAVRIARRRVQCWL